MLALLIIPVLVAGFIACHIHPTYYYKLHRYEGQYLYLKSTELGLKCLFIALAIAFFFHSVIPDSFKLCGGVVDLRLAQTMADFMVVMGAAEGKEATKIAWLVLLSVLTFVSAWVLCVWGFFLACFKYGAWRKKNRWKIRVGVMGHLLKDSPLDWFLFRASMQGEQDEEFDAMLCMSDRSVYVGRILSLGEPNETEGMDQDVLIMPFFTGYQDKDTLEVHLTAVPDELYEKGHYILVRQANIVQASVFDIEVYENQQAEKD
jgi:hypothetical protein